MTLPTKYTFISGIPGLSSSINAGVTSFTWLNIFLSTSSIKAFNFRDHFFRFFLGQLTFINCGIVR